MSVNYIRAFTFVGKSFHQPPGLPCPSGETRAIAPTSQPCYIDRVMRSIVVRCEPMREARPDDGKYNVFEAEIQGLYREVDESGAIRFYTYVVRE